MRFLKSKVTSFSYRVKYQSILLYDLCRWALYCFEVRIVESYNWLILNQHWKWRNFRLDQRQINITFEYIYVVLMYCLILHQHWKWCNFLLDFVQLYRTNDVEFPLIFRICVHIIYISRDCRYKYSTIMYFTSQFYTWFRSSRSKTHGVVIQCIV